MKTFNSKIEIKKDNKKNKRWLIILTAFLLLLLSIIICIFLCRDHHNNSNTENKSHNSTNIAKTSTTYPEEGTIHGTDNQTETVADITNPNTSTVSEGEKTTTDTDTNPYSPNDTLPETSNPVNQPVTDNETVQPTNPVIPDTTENALPPQNETHEEVGWIYRKATTYDYYKNYNKIEASDAIIITGFTNIPSNGIYDIPEKIDGKTVVGIDMSNSSAYTFNSAGTSVRKIYLPKQLNKINGNIFSACTDITDIYVKGNYLYMEPSALPEKSSRSGKITIHSTDDCWCLYGAKYLSVYCSPYGANEYYALWTELN